MVVRTSSVILLTIMFYSLMVDISGWCAAGLHCYLVRVFFIVIAACARANKLISH